MFNIGMQLRLGQQLAMTPQLQQAIRLLQLSGSELQQLIQDTLAQNVMLELQDDQGQGNASSVSSSISGALGHHSPDNDTDPASQAPPTRPGRAAHSDEATVSTNTNEQEWDYSTQTVGESQQTHAPPDFYERSNEGAQTLQEHLVWQLELARLDPRHYAIGRALIDVVGDDGYMTDDLATIQHTLRPDVEATMAEIENVLVSLQAFDPAGVAARSVAESIAIQLRQIDPGTPGRQNALRIAEKHLELVANKQYGLLRRELSLGDDELNDALGLVRACNPRPGAALHAAEPQYITPDVSVWRDSTGWRVEISEHEHSRLRINESYASAIKRGGDHASLRSQLQEARWLLRSLEIRNETIVKVARCIIDRQTHFFERGDEAMMPMVLRDIAEATEMHESTVSRVTTGKYMHTPRGLFEFRYFFSSHLSSADGFDLSSTAVRAKIKKLVAIENPRKPISDQRIAELLAADGVHVARRTVAKYRELMQIAPSHERRRTSAP